MMDFGMAFDKLAGFETAKELADFFKHEGVKGYKGAEESCPIANWMAAQTGESISVTGDHIARYIPDELDDWISDNYETFVGEYYRSPTEAMMNFIIEFDGGDFPELVFPEYDREY